MLKASRHQSVCGRCLAQVRNGLQPSSPAFTQLHSRQRQRYIKTQSSPTEIPLGQANIPKAIPGDPQIVAPLNRRPIREKLKDWMPPDDTNRFELIADSAFYRKVSNNNTRPQSTGDEGLNQFRSSKEGMAEGVDNGFGEDAEVAIVGSTARNPGDLVEMRFPGSRTPLFGIYLGYFGERHHFYARNGKWVVSLGFAAIFTVSNFASASEIRPLLLQLPKDADPDTIMALQRANGGPTREAGAELIEKMTKFVSSADEYYQSSLTNLDKARSLVSDGKKTKYLSLFEIAAIILPKSVADNGTHIPPAALYAVHSALHRNEFIFRPLSPSADSHRKDHLFEVFPYFDLMMINRVSAMARDYTDMRSKHLAAPSPEELEGSSLGNFVLKARELVQASRAKRSWTPYGILAPTSGVTLKTVEWSKSNLDIVRYLEWWASYDLFEESSRYHSYGSIILRSLELYDGAPLDQSTAWTFLQELGMIPPWEIPSRYKVRFPGVKIKSGGGLLRDTPAQIEESRRPDIAAGSRKELAGVNVLCIDAPSTMIIDDGVSLERTEKPDEFWIHVHTADPASGILPNSELCKFMELIPENIYLPGNFQAMLPSDIGVDDSNDYKSDSLVQSYSLAAGRPALTFSAKVNENGDLLDYKVEASVLHKVTYLDPEDVSKFCQEPAPPPVSGQTLTVGTLPEKAQLTPNRPMVASKDLDGDSQKDLLTLYRLAEAMKKKRLGKGAWPYFSPRPSVTVVFEDVPAADESSEGTIVLPPDPYIKVGYEPSNGASVVSNTMVLAGEIAARWCSDRGIAVPFRKDAKSSSNFDAIYEYATKEIYPLLDTGTPATAAQRQELSYLTGGIQLSPTPGPYFMLGLDMYAKATSPLRRFSDLIVHWQVHAALAHEREVKRRIDPALDDLDSILPFPSNTLDSILSLLHMREKMARVVSWGVNEWILMALVRAWKFENTAPRLMRFHVESQWRQGLRGRLDLFGLQAILDVDGMDALVLVKDVKVGDQFDVELADINVHSQTILVKATKYLGHDEHASA
ncbi:Mitochondrial protein cyt-4 [Neonectria ditissima]|uniref:Mitochondrial protein cyt-4 n=1 Tax=Neonectria ditissima TaxID=78410 RepID=A0A0P7BFZ4_9HYPO|nr:Mitochondrial protein cyt-4 [Neonectria ditissima]